MARGSGAWGAVVGAGTISAVAFVVAGPGVVQGVAFTVPFLVAPAVALTRWRQAEPCDRRLLATAATAVVLYCGVTLVWFLGPTHAGLAYPFPSVLDVGFLAAYSLFAVFLVMILRRQAGDAETESRVAVTDAAILTAAMASVVWSAEVIPLLDSGSTPLVAATALAYPCFTLVLAALAARLEQMAQWRLDWPDLIVAVNVSHLELLHADFVMTVHEVLERTGLEPTALRLEVTETVLADEATIATAIAPLVAAGIGFALDDFGTGHSSLSRLRHLQVGHLKIDKSFIDEIESDRGASAPLLSSIIALAHSIGQVVVAEGVETEQQAAFLADQSCDELQGYLISRPVAAEQVLPVLIATGTRARPPENGPDGWTALIEELVDPEVELDAVMPEVLARLSEVADLPCCFLTEVADGVQRTTHCHNVRPGSVRISTGLVVPWSGTLCHRLLEDGLVSVRSARDELADVPAARDLGIGLYLTVPIRDPQRRLVGTLCAASDEAATASVHQVQLMRVVADAVERRLGRPLSVA